MNIQVSNSDPTWMDFTIETTQLNDVTTAIQVGNVEESFFYGQMKKPELVPSAWNKFPTPDDPGSQYKFTSMEITVDPNLKQINR